MRGVRGRAVGAAFKARHSDRAGSDVVERGRLLCGELIENVVGIALAGAQSLGCHLLIEQGHDSGKCGRGRRGAANAKKIKRVEAAGTGDVRFAHDIEVSQESGAGEQRNIWYIAFTVIGNAGSSLPRWFCITSRATGGSGTAWSGA